MSTKEKIQSQTKSRQKRMQEQIQKRKQEDRRKKEEEAEKKRREKTEKKRREKAERKRREKAEKKRREKILKKEREKRECFIEKYRIRRARKRLRKIKVVSLIPARGQSKGVQRKNIVDLNGYPLIAYSIMASLVAGIKNTYVSTEDQEIKEISKVYGAKVIDRPEELATDDSSTESVVEHFLENVNCVVVVLIQPTSPMLLPIDLEEGVTKFMKEGYDSLFSAVKSNDILVWDQDMNPINYDPKNRMTRQTREKYILIENGAFFVFSKKMFLKEKCRLGRTVGYFEMPFWRSFQVDSKKDLEHVRKLMRRRDYGT